MSMPFFWMKSACSADWGRARATRTRIMPHKTNIFPILCLKVPALPVFRSFTLENFNPALFLLGQNKYTAAGIKSKNQGLANRII